MKRHASALLLLTCTLLLPGCLFTVNHPIVTPDGTWAVFLQPAGGYTLFPEDATLHLFRNGTWLEVAEATVTESGGLLDLSPDGTELLYVDIRSGEELESIVSALYRVAIDPDAVPVPLLESEAPIARARWAEDGTILLLRREEGEVGVLEALDPETGRTEALLDDVLSFALDPAGGGLFLIGAEMEELPGIGHAGRWDPVRGDGEELATFMLSEATIESFLTLPHEFFWDTSPDGEWLALAVYDQAMIDPEADDDLPAIYLIDLVFRSAERIAFQGLIPAFSPGGTVLAYLGTEDGDTGRIFACDVATGDSRAVPGTENAQTFFWIGPEKLGVTFEIEDDLVRLVELDLRTGVTTEILGTSPAQ